MLDVIEQVRVGSHNEFHATDDKGHGWNQTVTDFETVYHDCLVPKGWLQEHEHDLDGYEPTVELFVDGGKSISLNGNFKRGMIREWVKANKTEAIK